MNEIVRREFLFVRNLLSIVLVPNNVDTFPMFCQDPVQEDVVNLSIEIEKKQMHLFYYYYRSLAE
mgnify:FL=1